MATRAFSLIAAIVVLTAPHTDDAEAAQRWLLTGRTNLDKFRSAIGEEIYDIRILTNRGVRRIAVLGSDIANNPDDESN
jgi:hypothetical protein